MSIVKKIWKDPVVSAVIAGVVLAVAGSVWATLKGWWSTIGLGIAYGWHWLALSSSLPNWLLVVLSFCALAVVFLIAAIAISRLGGVGEPAVTWRSYRHDHYHGVDWQWSFEHGSGNVEWLTPLCPSCQCQLVRESPDYFQSSVAFVLHCKHCRKNIAEFKDDYLQVLRDVGLLIQRKVRTGEWRNMIGQSLAVG